MLLCLFVTLPRDITYKFEDEFAFVTMAYEKNDRSKKLENFHPQQLSLLTFRPLTKMTKAK